MDIFAESTVSPASNIACTNSPTPYSDATMCKKPTKHVKRPLNPFMVWSRIERENICKSDPTMHNAQISKLLGMRWKALTAEQRKPFIEQADQLRVLHMKEFPDYRYRPQKRRTPKKHNQKGTKSPDFDKMIEQAKIKSKSIAANKRLQSLIHEVETVIHDNSQPKVENVQLKRLLPKPMSLSSLALSKKTASEMLSEISQLTNQSNATMPSAPLKSLSSFSFSLYEQNLMGNDQSKKTSESVMSLNKEKQSMTVDKSETVSTDSNKSSSDSNKSSVDISRSSTDKPSVDIYKKSKDKSTDNKKESRSDDGMDLDEIISSLESEGRFTSGPICKIANDSNDPIGTFDYLTTAKINPNPASAAYEMGSLYRDYSELLKASQSLSADKKEYEEFRIPDIHEIMTWHAL